MCIVVKIANDCCRTYLLFSCCVDVSSAEYVVCCRAECPKLQHCVDDVYHQPTAAATSRTHISCRCMSDTVDILLLFVTCIILCGSERLSADSRGDVLNCTMFDVYVGRVQMPGTDGYLEEGWGCKITVDEACSAPRWCVAPGSWPQAPTVKTLVGLAHCRVQLREKKRVDTAGMDFCLFPFIVAAKSIIRWQRSAVPKTAPARRPSNMTVQYASSCFVETAANDMLLWRAA